MIDKARLRDFVDQCHTGPDSFSLTAGGDNSPFALCFGIFCLHMLKQTDDLATYRPLMVRRLRDNISMARRKGDIRSKSYRQLLCFTLSALAILDDIETDPLRDLIEEQIPADMERELEPALRGVPQSGNQAMFLAIFLLHAREYLGIDTLEQIKQWITLHRMHRNDFGFWGEASGPTHLQFQNGYHQYEIFDYIGAANSHYPASMATVMNLASADGHYAPWPGGDGCYDYDAVSVLTPWGLRTIRQTMPYLRRTETAIIAEQNPDGGFGSSHKVRPRFSRAYYDHVRLAPERSVFKERLRLCLSLHRPKHDYIRTHWSRVPRLWNQSNLWDSWFRAMTVARIECAFEPEKASEWGFIDYPGIGWHHSLYRDRGIIPKPPAEMRAAE